MDGISIYLSIQGVETGQSTWQIPGQPELRRETVSPLRIPTKKKKERNTK